MKNNFFILGCPRSGKTTLTNMIMKYDNSFNCIPLDSLILATKKNFPEVPIHNLTTVADLSKIILPFIETYVNSFTASYPEKKYIIEGIQVTPDDLMQSSLVDNLNIICLGFPNASDKEIFDNIRAEDAKLPLSYSRKFTDEQLKRKIHFYIRYSNFLQQKCKKYGIPFYETNTNRQQTLKIILNDIIEKRELYDDFQH